MSLVRVVRGGELQPGPASHDMSRTMTEVADVVSAAVARNLPQAISGWHHHGDRIACVYMLQGQLRLEWGPVGRETIEVSAGDFYVIFPNTIHREANPGTEDQVLIAFYLGSGPTVINVDAAEPE